MNKLTDYQSAWNRLVNREYKYEDISSVYNDLEILRPLVEKATPKKVEKTPPIKQDLRIRGVFFPKGSSVYWVCPNCGVRVIKLYHKNNCGNCGQKLCWEKEND